MTATICSYIFQYASTDSAIYKKALSYTDMIIKGFKADEQHGEMGISGYISLTNAIRHAGLTTRFDISQLEAGFGALLDAAIEKNAAKWCNYTARPSKFINSPQSPFYADYKDIINMELDYTLDERNAKGVWDINWAWFRMEEPGKYAKEFTLSENWWKGLRIIEKLLFLKEFDRIEL